MFTLQINTLAPKKVEKKIWKARVLSDNCRIFRNLKRYHQVLQKQKEKKPFFRYLHIPQHYDQRSKESRTNLYHVSRAISTTTRRQQIDRNNQITTKPQHPNTSNQTQQHDRNREISERRYNFNNTRCKRKFCHAIKGQNGNETN